jgi:glycosyltransferase involved in cell wall biosynthesis
MQKISLIIPCYNEEEALPTFYKEVDRVSTLLEKYEFEMLFIDDGSKDKTLEVIKGFAETDNRVKYLSFSRNFGKEGAMYAGFCNATGDYVAVMDADMQDPPSLLPEMLNIIEEQGYDSVATRRVTRKANPRFVPFLQECFIKSWQRFRTWTWWTARVIFV